MHARFIILIMIKNIDASYMYMYYIFLYLLRDYIWEQRVQFLNSVIKNLKS